MKHVHLRIPEDIHAKLLDIRPYGYTPAVLITEQILRVHRDLMPRMPATAQVALKKHKESFNKLTTVKVRDRIIDTLSDEDYYEKILGGTYGIPPRIYTKGAIPVRSLIFWYRIEEQKGQPVIYPEDTPKLRHKRNPYHSRYNINTPYNPSVYGDDAGVIAMLGDDFIE